MQLRAVQDYLQQHVEIRYAWYDFSCMPQDTYPLPPYSLPLTQVRVVRFLVHAAG